MQDNWQRVLQAVLQNYLMDAKDHLAANVPFPPGVIPGICISEPIPIPQPADGGQVIAEFTVRITLPPPGQGGAAGPDVFDQLFDEPSQTTPERKPPEPSLN